MAPAPLDLHTEVQRFFEHFVAAFGTFNGPHIAERYTAPYLAVDAHGGWRTLDTRDAIGAYFQQVVTQYFHDGCRSCRCRDLRVLALGTDSAVATVTWDLLRDDRTVLSAWRESYTLVRDTGGPLLRIAVSMDHAGREDP